MDAYLKTNSLTALYDAVFIPVITAAETDRRLDALDDEELNHIKQSIRDIIEDLDTRPVTASDTAGDDVVTEHDSPKEPMAAMAVSCRPRIWPNLGRLHAMFRYAATLFRTTTSL